MADDTESITMEVAVAILVREGKAKMLCVGCTSRLVRLGMVRLTGAVPLNDYQPGVVTGFFKIATTSTLEECRAAIADRHKGPKEWGD